MFIDLLEKEWFMKIIHSIVIVILSVIIYKIIISFLNLSEKKAKTSLFTSGKGKTYMNLFKSVIRSIFIVLTVLMLLQVYGINISSVLAGVGIFGVVFGLAIQDWLKDIIRGSSIISDGYFKVGDVVKYKDIEGRVLVIGLKTTRIQDLRTGNTISIANRNIDEASIVSKLVHIKIPIPYEISVQKAESAIDSIVKSINNNQKVDNCRYLGVTELADSSIDYLVEVECDPNNKLQVRRDALRSVLLGLAEHKIDVPFMQIDIHNK